MTNWKALIQFKLLQRLAYTEVKVFQLFHFENCSKSNTQFARWWLSRHQLIIMLKPHLFLLFECDYATTKLEMGSFLGLLYCGWKSLWKSLHITELSYHPKSETFAVIFSQSTQQCEVYFQFSFPPYAKTIKGPENWVSSNLSFSLLYRKCCIVPKTPYTSYGCTVPGLCFADTPRN